MLRRALGFVTSAYSSYSGCRQYLDDVQKAQAEVGPQAPAVEKLRAFFNHPGFIEVMVERVQAAFEEIAAPRRGAACLVFTAHSIPLVMAENCRYEQQLRETCRLAAAGVGRPDWRLVWQSRSGPPSQPWLEPDICDYLRELRLAGATDAVVVPIGFISDHMEVVYDLDTEARDVCEEIGLNMVRAATAGAHPRFVGMIRELIEERIAGAPKLAIGDFGPSHDVCAADCCAFPRRPPGA